MVWAPPAASVQHNTSLFSNRRIKREYASSGL